MIPSDEIIENLFDSVNPMHCMPQYVYNEENMKYHQKVITDYIKAGYDINVGKPSGKYQGLNPLEYFFATFLYPYINGIGDLCLEREEMILKNVHWFIDLMLENGIDPNYNYWDDGRTALFYAILNFHIVYDDYEIYRKLIVYGYDINKEIKDLGWSIVVWAHYRNYLDFDVLQQLVEWNDNRDKLEGEKYKGKDGYKKRKRFFSFMRL